MGQDWLTGWDHRTKVMSTGETGRRGTQKLSKIILQLFCKPKPVLIIEVYFRQTPRPDLSTWDRPFIETGETERKTIGSISDMKQKSVRPSSRGTCRQLWCGARLSAELTKQTREPGQVETVEGGWGRQARQAVTARKNGNLEVKALRFAEIPTFNSHTEKTNFKPRGNLTVSGWVKIKKNEPAVGRKPRDVHQPKKRRERHHQLA